MRHQCQIHGFLNAGGSRHRESGRPARHNVGMVAENRKRLCCQRACGNVKNRRKHFARDFVHIGNHQKQTLRSRKRRCQSSRRQRTVYGTGSTGFRLHLRNVHHFAEHIFTSGCRPFVGILTHRRGGGNRINGGNFTECIGNVRRSGVAVNRDHLLFFSHSLPLYFQIPNRNLFYTAYSIPF